MPSLRKAANRLGLVLGAICALAVLTSQAGASEHKGQFSEEFHHTYPLSAAGRVSLQNINGDVHISAWDRNEVKVDAVKYAEAKEDLADADIQVDNGADYVSIRTKYRQRDFGFNHREVWNNPASVEYTLTVPRSARLDKIELVNGSLDIRGMTGGVAASSINGEIVAHDLAGRAGLSTVNGRVDAEFSRLREQPIDIESVNGTVVLTLPSDAKAELEASTVHGGISNDFGLHVNNHHYVGHDLRGELAGGRTRIKLENVNGRIEIRRANDNRALSPAKDTANQDDDEI